MSTPHPTDEADLRLSAYRFDLPDDLVAQHPAARRDASRLMVLDKVTGETGLHGFAELPGLLPPSSLLVFNDAAVLPARLEGHRLWDTGETGGRAELLLLSPLPLLYVVQESGRHRAEAEVLIRMSKRLRPGLRFDFHGLEVEVLETLDFGRCRARLTWRSGTDGDGLEALAAHFRAHGCVPLPPYIKRDVDEGRRPEDLERYQCLHADPAKAGAVAAPTAGLHFSPALYKALEEAGHRQARVTCYVGYGTFSPIRSENLQRHRMHAEYIELPQATAEAAAQAKSDGRKVVAVGTTSARALEGAFQELGEIAPYTGETDIFIRPGHRFRVVDAMVTNFHLPGSSLVVMVSALAGREAVQAAYARAVRERMRFFSYGDAMLIR